jgi:hypothetical protein
MFPGREGVNVLLPASLFFAGEPVEILSSVLEIFFVVMPLPTRAKRESARER